MLPVGSNSFDQTSLGGGKKGTQPLLFGVMDMVMNAQLRENI